MTDNSFQARLTRSLSLPETWGFGLAGLMLWVLVAGDVGTAGQRDVPILNADF